MLQNKLTYNFNPIKSLLLVSYTITISFWVDLKASSANTDGIALYADENWLKSILGTSEREITNDSFVMDPLTNTPSLEIGSRKFPIGDHKIVSFSKLREQHLKNRSLAKNSGTRDSNLGVLKAEILTGIDALNLALEPSLSSDSVIQVASQFNGLESPSPQFAARVEDYFLDRTQGPRAVMPTVASVLFRQVFLGEFNALKRTPLKGLVKNGYLLWGISPPAFDYTLLDSMQILANHDVSPELRDHRFTQVFSAAIPIDSYGNHGDLEVQEALGYQLLARQYLAVGYIAAQKVKERLERVRIHLSLVGRGAFNNSTQLSSKVLKKFLETFRDDSFDVFIHIFKPEKENEIIRELKDFGVEWKQSTSPSF